MQKFTTQDGYRYQVLDSGLIQQIDFSEFIYDSTYISTYNTAEYKENSTILNSLRYGMLISSLGRIPDTICDFGYGNGDFGRIASLASKVYGYDVSSSDCPKHIHRIEFNDLLNLEFDVVTFYDSLEHCPNISFVRSLKTKNIHISVPNVDKDNFETWHHRKPNEHLWHFDKDSLDLFMSDMGYKRVLSNNIEDVIRRRGDYNIHSGFYTRK